jgi:hypothetical protein
MENVVMRVWLPDRPGALGAVASRIGAVRGDLIGVDILERGGGRAIDELIVALPDPKVIELLIREMGEVDGVSVEEVRMAGPAIPDPRLDALETAAVLVEQTAPAMLLQQLVNHAVHDFESEWSAVIDSDGRSGPVALASVGEAPPAVWLAAFVAGGASSALVAAGQSGPDGLAWAPLTKAELAVLVGRDGRPFRARERQQLAALARIADRRWVDLQVQANRAAHPSMVHGLVSSG